MLGLPHSMVSDMLVLWHGNDDISLFVPLVYIPVRLDNLPQGIASVYDRSDRARCNEVCEGHEILRCLPADVGPVAGHPCKKHA
jgi:hypothetical protein